jgi:predicted NUDIX family phosphoesterase
VSSKEAELILGVPRERLLGGRTWHGIIDQDLSPYLEVIASEGEYRPRGEAEDDSAWKQIIPYLLLRDQGRIFLMRRTKAGTDARLHERWSIGVGGHLNPEDGGVEQGLRREFEEELDADWHPEFRLLGLLNDDSTPVGQVHFGVIFEADADGRAVAVRETDKLSGEFVHPDAVLQGYERLETWSQLLYDHVTGRVQARVEPG